ncbi:prepilin-type N-terminal cleavage/methylation domain-containing protein [Pontiellaceae bacterium B1224]|nr:prepilin-type N-terminal cleavage/methylation domain-containing protein [Pontiellaceae bacterium B1224]
MSTMKNRRGFTLLEIVVSITLLALMALMLARIFTESTRAVGQGRERALLDETARFVLNNLEQDISQALIRTNVAFRVEPGTAGDTLYCISPGIRRQTETYPRDTAPIQFRTVRSTVGLSALNDRIVFEYASSATATTKRALKKLIDYSNIYQPLDLLKSSGQVNYTERLDSDSGVLNQASLTFLDFDINGDPDSNYGSNQLPDPDDPPRFVDVHIGLVSSKNMQQAMRLYSAQGDAVALDYLSKREQVYTRRIFMPNTGFTGAGF